MSTPVLDLDSVVVRYGKFTALRSLTTHFPGGALGVLGPNGAGKTSLIRAILGLLSDVSGTLRVFGEDARKQGPKVRARIGYLPERDCYIGGLSGVRAIAHLAEISALPPQEAMARAHDVLHFTGVGEERYREVASYSTGMKQRWKLAAALVHDPDLLILDEPTNGLDPPGRAKMLELIDMIRREYGLHVILASHLLPDVERVCDQVWVLENGQLRRAGRIDELTESARGGARVRVRGEAIGSFREQLTASGISISEDKGDLLLSRADGVVAPSDVFEAAHNSSVRVVSLRPAARSLEDAFLEALEGDD